MTDTHEDKRFCTAVTKEGKPCRQSVSGSTNFCMIHDPNRDRAKFKQASAAGGKKSQEVQKEKKRLSKQLHKELAQLNPDDFAYETKEDLDRLLQQTMYRVSKGIIDAKVAAATTNAISVAARLLELEKSGKSETPIKRFNVWIENLQVNQTGGPGAPVTAPIRDVRRLLGVPGNGSQGSQENETTKDKGVAPGKPGKTLQFQKPDPNRTAPTVGEAGKEGEGGQG